MNEDPSFRSYCDSRSFGFDGVAIASGNRLYLSLQEIGSHIGRNVPFLAGLVGSFGLMFPPCWSAR